MASTELALQRSDGNYASHPSYPDSHQPLLGAWSPPASLTQMAPWALAAVGLGLGGQGVCSAESVAASLKARQNKVIYLGALVTELLTQENTQHFWQSLFTLRQANLWIWRPGPFQTSPPKSVCPCQYLGTVLWERGTSFGLRKADVQSGSLTSLQVYWV